ncbi:site-specific DNA-methyltransferase [Salmonella enterica]|nr:site-specific DNA-methyltransferase [Salmonella enterica]EEP1004655.1 site-specific DNA-methyltransferase [Salmonella enterica]EEP1008522.1 site-specific DNA-methyltransferase [Salmonella enterica]EEP1018060.1 site-specific DNA-methyltransferase [Salmonella enterica]EEP1024156.1 site-specific DNA-methyltransferase [Salmonella enterica]
MPFLDWVNKNQAKAVSISVPYHLLQKEAEFGSPSKDNMVIQGDNLLALRALMPLYASQVKCIFIDPPYNTQSAFEHYDDKLEHSQWLSMMYPRLVLLRDLLAEDGSIWVTLDDNEAHYMKVMMDEIFGRTNFVANVIWQKKYAVANDHKTIAPMHDHILVYRKSPLWKRNLLPRTNEKDRQYKYEDARGIFRPDNYTCSKSADERPNLYYPIKNPNTGEEIWPKKTRVWSYSREEHLRHVQEDFIYWGKDSKGKTPSFKRYKHLLKNDGVVPHSLWAHDFAGHTDGSRKEVRAVLDSNSLLDDFITPKPELLISRVFEISTHAGDLVLDSFLGSGTSAAVAHKMNRRYIGIEMGEHAKTHCIPRLQKVINGEQGGISQSVEWQGGGGFSFYTLNPEPVFQPNGQIRPDIKFAPLAAYIWHHETGMGALQAMDKPYLGSHNETAYYLLYNGILGDRRPNSGNVLTRSLLAWLLETFPHEGPKVIYGETSRIGPERLAQANVTFKQIPYDIVLR